MLDNRKKSKELENLIESWKSRKRKNVRYKMAGDMPERLEWLIERFSGISDIVEFGSYEGCSSAAWLSCASKSFISVDIQKMPHHNISQLYDIAKEIGVEYKFIVADDLKLEPIECDLLFIDTMHSIKHTYEELKRHAHAVKKYLVFHDTNPEFCGTQKGIDKWIEEQPKNEWKEIYNENSAPIKSPARDCGLSVWERI